MGGWAKVGGWRGGYLGLMEAARVGRRMGLCGTGMGKATSMQWASETKEHGGLRMPRHSLTTIVAE